MVEDVADGCFTRGQAQAKFEGEAGADVRGLGASRAAGCTMRPQTRTSTDPIIGGRRSGQAERIKRAPFVSAQQSEYCITIKRWVYQHTE